MTFGTAEPTEGNRITTKNSSKTSTKSSSIISTVRHSVNSAHDQDKLCTVPKLADLYQIKNQL